MTALCPVGSRDFRDDQCQSFNGKEESNDGFRYSSPNITWNAVYELGCLLDDRVTACDQSV